jgi:hypothetical protein
VAKKKDNKATEKRRAKSKQEKQRKRHLKLIKEKRKEEADLHFTPPPHMADIEAPDGFRAVSMSQALVAFAKPLMKDVGGGVKELNEIFGISNLIWNYEILDREESNEAGDIKKKIMAAMRGILGLRVAESEELLEKMLDRKRNLFPEDIQPRPSPIMFMRKELSHLIASFNYDGLIYSAEPIPPDEHDHAAIEKIKRMDQYIVEGAEYDEWEDFSFSMQEVVQGRYEKWLSEKGLTEWSQIFASNLELFFSFIYRYMHDDLVILKSVPPEYFEEFFFDFLLRKLIAEPHEYVLYPPTLKFFYRFLLEKGYMPDSERTIGTIDALEPEFMDILRERFG